MVLENGHAHPHGTATEVKTPEQAAEILHLYNTFLFDVSHLDRISQARELTTQN